MWKQRLRTADELLKAWDKNKFFTPMELSICDPTYLVEVVMRLRELSAATGEE